MKFPPHGYPLYYDTLRIQTMGVEMAHKKFKKFWLIYGRVSGFAIGFNVDKYSITLDLGFWYVGIEY